MSGPPSRRGDRYTHSLLGQDHTLDRSLAMARAHLTTPYRATQKRDWMQAMNTNIDRTTIEPTFREIWHRRVAARAWLDHEEKYEDLVVAAYLVELEFGRGHFVWTPEMAWMELRRKGGHQSYGDSLANKWSYVSVNKRVVYRSVQRAILREYSLEDQEHVPNDREKWQPLLNAQRVRGVIAILSPMLYSSDEAGIGLSDDDVFRWRFDSGVMLGRVCE